MNVTRSIWRVVVAVNAWTGWGVDAFSHIAIPLPWPGGEPRDRAPSCRVVSWPLTRGQARRKRIALVTDLDWMITMTSLFGWMPPGELKRFPLAERDAAISWAVAD